MKELNELEKYFYIVKTNEIEISSNKYPVIGTIGLGPCISFVLHNKELKKTIVGHLSADIFLKEENILNIINRIYKLIKENNLKNKNFDLYLIKGAINSNQDIYLYDYNIIGSCDTRPYTILEVLEILLKNIKVIKIDNIIKNNQKNIQTVDLNGNITDKQDAEVSNQFAFDSKTGKFITNKMLFDIDCLGKIKKK